MLKLNELDEFRCDAYESVVFYAEKTKIWYDMDKHIMRRNFCKGQKVLLFNSKLGQALSGKIKNKMVRTN